jgi:pimeloyl-ACP methyl ester carboxylesterase
MTTSTSGGQMVPINGIEMYYETHGEGEPVVLLHGFSGAGSNWQGFIGGLAREYQLIIPDLRGHGHSTNPSGDFTFRQSALDIFALLDHLAIDQCKAIGVSAGGKTLLHMATQRPARIEAMVIASTAPYFPEPARAIMQQLTVESYSDADWQLMRQWHQYGDEQIRTLWRQGHAFKDSYDDMNFTPPYLATITARTLIVHGDRDPIYPVSLALEMYQAIPRSYLWVIPNGEHGSIFTMVEHFNETALAFLRGAWNKE